MQRVLVLNMDYTFVGICDWKDAICAVYTDKAYVEEEYDRVVHSTSMEMNIPSVIRLKKFVKIVFERIAYVSFTKNNIHRRDSFTCQYCSDKLRKDRVTIDHVVPESRGGKDTWENCVTACKGCNAQKDDKLPHEVGMKLIKQPRKPRGFAEIVKIKLGELHESWHKYLGIED